MPREFLKIRKTHRAVALAQGVSVQAWARANEVPGSTASPWASDPEVCHLVESIQRRVADRAIRGLSRRATRAASAILELAESAESESVRLKALQTVLADPMINGKYAKLKERVAGIERQLRERRKLSSRGPARSSRPVINAPFPGFPFSSTCRPARAPGSEPRVGKTGIFKSSSN